MSAEPIIELLPLVTIKALPDLTAEVTIMHDTLPSSMSRTANWRLGAHPKRNNKEETIQYINRIIRPDTEKARQFWYTSMIKVSGKTLVERTITLTGGGVAAYVAHNTILSGELWGALSSIIPRDVFDCSDYQHVMDNDNTQLTLISVILATAAAYAGRQLSSLILRIFLSIPHSLKQIYTIYLLHNLKTEIDRMAEPLEENHVVPFIAKQITEVLILLFDRVQEKCYKRITKVINEQNSDIHDYELLKECKEECQASLEILLKKRDWHPDIHKDFFKDLNYRFEFMDIDKLTEFLSMIPKKTLESHVEHAKKVARTELLSNYYYLILHQYLEGNATTMAEEIKGKDHIRKKLEKKLNENYQQKEQQITDLIQNNTSAKVSKPEVITHTSEISKARNAEMEKEDKERKERCQTFLNSVSTLQEDNRQGNIRLDNHQRRTHIKRINSILNNIDPERRTKELGGDKIVRAALDLI